MMEPTTPRTRGGTRIAPACRALAESNAFQIFIFGVILANAVVLGIQTYDAADREYGDLLHALNDVFLGIFVVEIAIRIAAYGRRPQDYFRDGWNVFDFVIIAAAFAPGLRQNATLLRLVRLLRVVRIVTLFPDLRVLVGGMVRSLPPIGSLALLTVLLLYVYGMVGWILYHDHDPENWGTIGQSMGTLFIILTLENWPVILEPALEYSNLSWIFFVSYVLITSFLLINILIAVLINSLEESRRIERDKERAKRQEERAKVAGHEKSTTAVETLGDSATLDRGAAEERLGALRDALEDLEAELGVDSSRRVSMPRARGLRR